MDEVSDIQIQTSQEESGGRQQKLPEKPSNSLLGSIKIHPLSAILVIGLDTLLFAGSAASAGILMTLSIFAGFLGSFIGVSLVEKFFGNESLGKSLTKGLILGILTGIPTPIAGTAVGAFILAIGGLDKLKNIKNDKLIKE